MAKRYKNIYERYNNCSKDEVDAALATLNEEEQELVRLKYGSDFENPVTSPDMTKSQKAAFGNRVIPHLNKQLLKVTPLVETDNAVTKTDCLKIIELMRTSNFADMNQNFTVKESVIVALHYGYIDNKYFDSATIAEFLGISMDEVTQVTIKAAKIFRNRLNEMIEAALSELDGESRSLKP